MSWCYVYERLALSHGLRCPSNGLRPVLRAEMARGEVSSLVTRPGTWAVGQVLNAGGPWGAKVATVGRHAACSSRRNASRYASLVPRAITALRPSTGVPCSQKTENPCGAWR